MAFNSTSARETNSESSTPSTSSFTLSQSSGATSSSPTLISNQPSQSTTSPPQNMSGSPTSAIAGAVVAGVFVLLAALFLFHFFRRKMRPRRRSESMAELGSELSPIVDKEFNSNPFMTDSQARLMGLDIRRQSTRRIEAKFMMVDPVRSASPSPPRNTFSTEIRPGEKQPPLLPAPVVRDSPEETNSSGQQAVSPQEDTSAAPTTADHQISAAHSQSHPGETPTEPITSNTATSNPPLTSKIADLVVQLGLDHPPPPEAAVDARRDSQPTSSDNKTL